MPTLTKYDDDPIVEVDRGMPKLKPIIKKTKENNTYVQTRYNLRPKRVRFEYWMLENNLET